VIPQRLRWRLIRRLPGLIQGDFLSLSKGSGFDLVNLQLYQPGDDVRRIDWNASARSGELHLRLLREDRDLSAWVVADLSASQDGGTGRRNKRSQLIDLCELVVASIAYRGNRIGLWIDDGSRKSPVHLPPRGGRAQQLRIVHQLRAHRAPQPPEPSDLRRLFAQLSAALRRRSLLFLLSDFLGHGQAPADWQSHLAALARRHDLIAVHLEDPSEWELPAEGPSIVEDAETGEQIWIDGDDPGFRARYAQALDHDRQAVHRALQSSGARFLALRTDHHPLEELVQWLRRPARIRTG
jgi:uncharacterized protein (DUF58 family)